VTEEAPGAMPLPRATHKAIWRLAPALRRRLWAAASYEPSAEQRAAHLDPHRLKLVAGGERAGKSRWTAQEIHDWLWVSRDGQIWIVGPTYDLAQGDFMHVLGLAAESKILEPGSESLPRHGSCSFKTKAGVLVVTRTSKDEQTLAAVAPLGVAMVEAAQHTYSTFLRCRGRVSEKRGPLLLSGTFEGSLGWYPELWQRWQSDNLDGGRSFSLPTWSNRAVFPGGRDDPEIRAMEATLPEDTFMERVGAVPCPPRTLVFREFAHLTHVRERPFKPELPVQLWVDPGYAGAYAVVVVQIEGGVVSQIDEVYRAGMVSEEIIRECQVRPWWAKVTLVVMDVAGRQHHATASHFEVWRRVAGKVPVGNPVGVADGIQRHRTFLINPADKEPRLLHDPRCKGTIAEYGLYKYHEVRENRAEREEPVDANNHAMKAIAYGLVWNFGFVTAANNQPPKITVRVRR